MGRIYTPDIPAFGKGSDSSLGCHGHLGQIHSSTLHFLQFIPLLQLLEIPCPPDGECADQNLHLLKSSNAGEFVGGPQMHWEEILSISVERSVLNTPNLFIDGFVPLRGKETQQFIHFFFFFFPSFLFRYFRQILLGAVVTGAVDLSLLSSRQIRGTNPDPWSSWDARDVSQPRDAGRALPQDPAPGAASPSPLLLQQRMVPPGAE